MATRESRDGTGKFLPGNASKGGRPPKDREEDYQKAFTEACSKNDWKRIIKRAVSQALDGDKDARKWLSDNILGLPIQRIAPANATGQNMFMGHSDQDLVLIAQSIAAKKGIVIQSNGNGTNGNGTNGESN